MFQTKLFPQVILDRYANEDVIFHGRLTTKRNDGCWFVVFDIEESEMCHVSIISKFDHHEVVEYATINKTNLFDWLANRIDY